MDIESTDIKIELKEVFENHKELQKYFNEWMNLKDLSGFDKNEDIYSIWMYKDTIKGSLLEFKDLMFKDISDQCEYEVKLYNPKTCIQLLVGKRKKHFVFLDVDNGYIFFVKENLIEKYKNEMRFTKKSLANFDISEILSKISNFSSDFFERTAIINRKTL